MSHPRDENQNENSSQRFQPFLGKAPLYTLDTSLNENVIFY